MRKTIIILVVIAVAGLVVYFVKARREAALYNDPGFSFGNGRLEATEVNVASKLSGKIEKILVNEGDFVKKGQHLAQMQTNVLQAELDIAKAQHRQAVTSAASAKAKIDVKKGELEAAKAVVKQKASNAANAKKRYERAKQLMQTQAISSQAYDNDETIFLTAEAELAAAQASVKQAEAEVNSAIADAAGAEANIQAMLAEVARYQADLDDSRLTAPIDGRVQYRIAEAGEVLSAGGRVLNLVDLTDVYMTFFLPEGIAGKVAIGADARIILDALPDVAIPAKITFVADVAQFTPKTVETQIERQKLMFRVKAKIAPELLKKYIEYVKTGLPGVAYVKINPEAKWPDFLKTQKEKAAESKLTIPLKKPSFHCATSPCTTETYWRSMTFRWTFPPVNLPV